MKEVDLTVREARKQDRGKGTARINSVCREGIGVRIGAIIEIGGRKKTLAVVDKAFHEDRKKDIIRIDRFVRKNAGINLGERATVKPVSKIVEAHEVTIAPADMQLNVDKDFATFVKNRLEGRVLLEKDVIAISFLGHYIPFSIVKSKPSASPVRISVDTLLTLLDSPVPLQKTQRHSIVGTQLSVGKQKIPYDIDLKKLSGDGVFLCPKCGVEISPHDETEDKYTISSVYTRDGELDRLRLTCLKCKCEIELAGFHFDLSDRKEIGKRYEMLKPLYRELVREGKFILAKRLKQSELKVHGIEARVKNFDSFYEKIVRNEIHEDPFEEVDDLAAVRIICLYCEDLEKICEIIIKNFNVLRSDTSRTRSEEHFGYMSDHYIVMLPEKFKGVRYDEIKHLKFEIQVRTILMHAWASVSHHLDYKQEIDIPATLRKEFNALSGLFFTADSQFEKFRKAIEQAKSKLKETVEQDAFNFKQEINLDNFVVYLKWKFPGRKDGVLDSTLLDFVRKAGYRRFAKIDRELDKVIPAINQLEIENWRQPILTREDIIRISLGIGNPYFKRVLSQKKRKR